jgi:hypothetical protein
MVTARAVPGLAGSAVGYEVPALLQVAAHRVEFLGKAVLFPLF